MYRKGRVSGSPVGGGREKREAREDEGGVAAQRLRSAAYSGRVTPRRRILTLVPIILGIALGLMDASRHRASVGADPRILRLELSEDGTLRVLSESGDFRALGRLSLSDGGRSADTLEALEGELKNRTKDPAQRDPDTGKWKGVLDLAVASRTPWFQVQWIVRTAAATRISAVRLTAGGAGEPTFTWTLPREGSFRVPLDREGFVRVSLIPNPGGLSLSAPTVLRASIGYVNRVSGLEDLVQQSGPLDGVAAFRSWLRVHSGKVHGLEGEVETPLPGGAFLPLGEVLAVLHALQEAVTSEVQLMGQVQPLPHR